MKSFAAIVEGFSQLILLQNTPFYLFSEKVPSHMFDWVLNTPDPM